VGVIQRVIIRRLRLMGGGPNWKTADVLPQPDLALIGKVRGLSLTCQAFTSLNTPIKVTDDIDLQPIPDGKTLSGMLEAGELDAMIAARAPSAFLRGATNIARLWPDFRTAEEDYFKRTGLFPIMHLIGIRRSLVEKHPWLAPSVLKAFTRAKAIVLEEMEDVGISRASLPWLPCDVAHSKEVMGSDIWPYGFEANKKAIECMLRWSVEQGLSHRAVPADELLAPGTLQDL
jgi:4,5-dihydroxyphthalate decarboxylase